MEPLGQDTWRITETDFAVGSPEHRETIFSQANGYLGLRGNFEEAGGACSGTIGAYINGFYESNPITYGESAHAYAKNSQTMLNVTNGQIIRLFLGDEPFAMDTGIVEKYRRSLSLRDGVLTRDVTWVSPSGKRAVIHIERLVSFENRHLAAWRYEVTPLDFSGTVTFRSGLDGDVRNRAARDDPRVGANLGRALHVDNMDAGGCLPCIVSSTRNSGLAVCCGMSGKASKPCGVTTSVTDTAVTTEYAVQAVCGEPVVFEKFLCYVDSRHYARDGLRNETKAELSQALELGFGHFRQAQVNYLEAFWADCGVDIDGDESLRQGLRYNLFQLLQSAGTDGMVSAGSKGLSGEGYEGHYFWDTEMYLTPFFIFTKPEIARQLLRFRYRTLGRARARAREMSHQSGALYPWRTINGDECSAYFPAGTAQYHIDGDIAHAVKLYFEATGDEAFLRDEGAEILVETARLWADTGFYNPEKGGRFCINGVTGPDEYNALVNNNLYTNMVAAENLRAACAACALLRDNDPAGYGALRKKTGLRDDEPDAWAKAAENMYIPFDEKQGVHLQDDGFLDRQPWNFDDTPADHYPLLLHYHPLVIYRHRVCKQADMVLAMFLFPDAFTPGQKKKDYAFYEAVTTHDSSLSTSIFSIVASRLGYTEKAYRYFLKTARMDLDDCNGNTGDGIHTANMAGAWMGVTCGFGGMRIRNGELCFAPVLPDEWEGYRFHVVFRGSRIGVSCDREGVGYELLAGGPVTLRHGEEPVRLQKPGDSALFTHPAV